ncbi:spindle and centriole-associated protein 1 isoform X2 [Paroedura picta]|uniref:spindle and centriole-associated protein 1 isoform X2 n=1 Tax=Paroedura picta TaxID=143630 RepID=UPI00405601EF
MSLLRGGRFPTAAAARKPPRARRKKPAAQQEWDATVQDLTVHRATPEEMVRRHEMHKSKNKALARLELQEKALKGKWKKQRARVPESLEKRKLALMREILSDQYHLQDVLERSDRAMAVVKDLFGDAPRRHIGFPNVTVAPDCDAESTQGPIAQKCDPPTQLSILSESVMDPQALNEVRERSSGFPLEGENIQDSPFNSGSLIDTNRAFRLPGEKGSVTGCHEKAIQQGADATSTQEANVLATPSAGLPSLDSTALNATNVVKRVHSRLENEEQIADITYIVQQVLNANLKKPISAKVKKTQTALSPARQKKDRSNSAPVPSGNMSSLEALNQMLRDVEQEMNDYARWTGHEVQQAPNGHGLSGFTYSLVNAVCRMMRFLKESEGRLRQEVLSRQRLEGEVHEHRALIDALTAEILLVREENLTLQSKLQQYMFVTDEQLTSVTRALKGLPTSDLNRTRSPGETGGLSIRSPEAVKELHYTIKGDQIKALHASLPSPAESTGREPGPEERSSVLGKPLTVWEDGALFPQGGRVPITTGAPQSNSPPVQSVFSAVARPGLGGFGERLHFDPPATCAQDDDLQGQIAELTFQNSVIRAQLSKFRQSHLESGDRSEQQLSTAQNAPVQEEQETSQAPSSTTEPPKSLDQRIAELNRQSTEARNKLLQLIRQQKLATLGSVSPPISPIPPPAVNWSGSGRRKIEISVPVAETLDSSKEDISSPSSGTSAGRSAGTLSQMSLPQSAALGNTPLIPDSRKVKAEKPKDEGWFALSMHVR